MRICLVHQYYKTPKTGGAIRSYYIANYLKELGHEVTVITATNNDSRHFDNENGFDVHYLPVYYQNHLNFSSRIHAFMRYAWKATRKIKKLGKFDLLYIITTPLSTGYIGEAILKKFGTPYIFEVGDLWPQAPIELGVIKNPALKRWSRRLEKRFYKKAIALVGLSPSIRKSIQQIVPDKEVITVTNFSDKSLLPQEKQHDKNRPFTIAYVGTIGLANNLEYLIRVAEVSRGLNMRFWIVGEGARKSSLEKLVETKKLDNVTFFQHRSKSDLNDLLASVDALYISFKNLPVLATGSPNKFFDALAAGKMVIINFEGWIKELVEKHQLGLYHHPEDPEALLEQLKPYMSNPELTLSIRENALRLADEYSPQVQLPKLKRLIESLKL